MDTDTPTPLVVAAAPQRHGRKWAQSELNQLTYLYQDHDDVELGVLLRRKPLAIFAKRRELHLDRRCGYYTLSGLMKAFGVNQRQVLRARDALHQRWRRQRPALRGGGLGPLGHAFWYVIEEDQADEIMAWLRPRVRPAVSKWLSARTGNPRPEWGPTGSGLLGCFGCGRRGSDRSRRYRARGLCAGCYAREWRRVREGRSSKLLELPVFKPDAVKFLRRAA